MQKVEEQHPKAVSLVIDDAGAQANSEAADNFQRRMMERQRQMEAKKLQSKTQKAEKSKEELAEIRKNMMKKKTVVQKQKEEEEPEEVHPKSALMSRLASGTKAQVTKKDMLKLTNKNYENLPEVRKQREEQQKKEQMKQRKALAKEMEKQRRDQLRNKY